VRFAFGECALDVATRQLLRDGREVPVPPKAFDLLALLVAERPRVVSKAEIHSRLWPGTFVTQSNLTSLMADLRTAIADGARQRRFVRTVHGVGYAFCGVVEDDAPAEPSLGRLRSGFRLFCQDREIALQEGENVLGRTGDVAVWIDSATVSRRHAQLVVDGGRVVLEDLGSRNGTWVRGERIAAPVELQHGDEFRLGRVPVTLRALRTHGSTRSSTRP
jgi:DNA-binding winged helix-turn-helix (wHTH) protein